MCTNKFVQSAHFYYYDIWSVKRIFLDDFAHSAVSIAAKSVIFRNFPPMLILNWVAILRRQHHQPREAGVVRTDRMEPPQPTRRRPPAARARISAVLVL
jgi:hypothetical protein